MKANDDDSDGSGKVGADASTETWETERGSLVISHPAPGVIVFTYDGYVTAAAVLLIERSVDRVLATGVRPDLFIDLARLTGYDSEYRKAVSAWGARLYRQFGEVRVFVRSKLVAVGIAVSNLTAGGKLRPTTDRGLFDRALADAVARHSAPPRP
jgi:hypothetical protein